jgi:threonine dehydratase
MLTNARNGARKKGASTSLTGDDIVAAWRTIESRVRRTPTVSHRLLSRRFGSPVYVKLENNQTLGSFKLRGWVSLFARLDEDERRRGIVTCAHGEHVRPLAAAAEQFGVAYRRVVAAEPGSGPRPVRANEVVVEASDATALERAAHELAERSGARYVDPSLEPAWIAGVGSVGFELVEQAGQMPDVVFVPVGTGALATGIAIAIKSVRPQTHICGVQVEAGGNTARDNTLNLVAELAGRRSEAAESRLDELLDQRITVREADLHDAIRTYAETLRQAASGAGAAALAGARQQRDRLDNACIGVILSGGNIDVSTLRRVLDGEPAEDSTDELRELVGHVYR